MAKKDSRIKNNLITSLVYQIVLISINFILPILYIEDFGSDVNGVLQTIKQIFSYLCLLEAGIGLASTQALYKKIGNDDYKSANEVLSATHVHYVRTGILYSVIVLIIAVVYGYLIETPVDNTVLFFLIILNALPSLFSFFVKEKYKILMEVDGRKYIINSSETVVQIVTSIGKLLVLLLTKNLILIQTVYCVAALIQYLYLYLYAKRRYKWIDLKAKPDFGAISQKNSVLVHQLSGMVFNSTDVLLISILCDFKVTSVYSIYNIFFSQVQAFITGIVSSFNFALGQMFHVDRKRFDKLFNAYETFHIMGAFIVYTLMAVFLLPLIQIYTKGATDIPYSNPMLLFLFVIMSLLANSKLPLNSVIEYAGDFKKTRSYAIWEMIINLSVSVVALFYMGVCGALIGTIAALLYRSIVTIYFANKNVLKRSQICTYKTLIANGVVFTAIMIMFFVDGFINISFLRLLLSGILHSIWIVGLYLLINFLLNKEAFKTIYELYREKKNK